MKAFKAWAVIHKTWPTPGNCMFLPTNEPRIYTIKSHAEYYADAFENNGDRTKVVHVEIKEVRKKK